jgi:hypothetical protein
MWLGSVRHRSPFVVFNFIITKFSSLRSHQSPELDVFGGENAEKFEFGLAESVRTCLDRNESISIMAKFSEP